MKENTPLQKVWQKIPVATIGILLVLAVMVAHIWINIANSFQSQPAIYPDIYFEGQYQIGDGPWNPVVAGQHIPATKGDVTMKGTFHMMLPNGEYIGQAGPDTTLALYASHIHITVQEEGMEPYINDVESDVVGKDLCGEYSVGYILATEAPVTLIFHNPHRFGNENAIDEFLQELSIYADFVVENQLMDQGKTERSAGMVFAVVAFVLLGTALFCELLRLEGSGRLWIIGLCVLFAGGYFAYGSKGVFLWSASVVGNTTVLGSCMMLYMLCVCALICSTLQKKCRKIAIGATIFMGFVCAGMAIAGIVTTIRFYDTWLWWAIAQSVANAVLLVCLALECPGTTKGRIATNMGAAALLLCFEADFLGTAMGWWHGGVLSKYIFMLLFVVALVLVWQIIPRNFNAARRAREMEAEQKVIRAQLQENRIAIMISQIQPHFIYNTLGTIQQLCKENPEQASQLVRNFSLYLRGNFSELDNTMPIRFSKELEHVRCYTDIELIRFPDMTVRYDIRTEEFLLPALTVQPLVENAIKHGLMGREEGGTVTVTAFETATHYCVMVADDGVGFDQTAPLDERKHIGIRNVRERLQGMCGGSLSVESEPGKGTTALIQLPKEGKKA